MAAMSALQQDVIIIHGTTSNGKVFRPSDWAERLCGILSSFTKDNRLSYHEWVCPILIEKIRCVSIDPKLEEINPSMFRFLMDFAADNDLQVLNGKADSENGEEHAVTVTVSETAAPAAPTADIGSATEDIALVEAVSELKEQQTGYVLREIPPAETATAFAALSVLRPMLKDINGFVEQVNKVQREQGYRLIGVFEEGKTNAVAVCGFREETNLVSGRHLHIDDLITVPQSRQRGYAALLLAEVSKIARSHGIVQLHLDSNVGSDRTTAHRVYFQHGFDITAYHFVCKMDKE